MVLVELGIFPRTVFDEWPASPARGRMRPPVGGVPYARRAGARARGLAAQRRVVASYGRRARSEMTSSSATSTKFITTEEPP